MERVAGPFLLVRVAGASLALPISVVERIADTGQRAQLDLGEFVGLVDATQDRAAAIALKTAAGVVVSAVDGIGEVVQAALLQPVPPVTRLTVESVVRGLIRLESGAEPGWSVLLDGASLGDLVAERVLERPP
ncbi:MAG: hypothetical protein JXR83_03710 [Deltaproteobacteria bacterium]|nr:hypothetical protein [Deltaproteobacteria bacterium]